MSRRFTLGLALFTALAGCSNLLGLKPPSEASDGGASDGTSDGAPQGTDFTVQLAHVTARVPAGGFDFVTVVVARSAGTAGPITVDVPQPPPGVTTMAGTIAATATTGEVKVVGDASLTIGSTLSLDIVATGGGFTHDVHVSATVTGIPGTLDTTFGGANTGFLDVPLGGLAGAFGGIAVDGSDDPIAAGSVENSIASMAQIAILHPDGTLLTTAGSNPCSCSGGSTFNTLALTSTGHVLAVGQGFDKTIPTPADEPLISAFDGSGVAIPTFNASGAELIEIGADLTLTSVAVDSTNVVSLTNSGLIFRIPVGGGARDLAWNGGQPIPVQISAPGRQAIAIDPAQHVYVAGQGSGSGSSAGTAVLESITEAGLVDPDFGSGGIADSGVAGTADAAIVQADHGIIVAGIANGTFLLFRVLPSGALDPAFGTGGISQPALSVAAGSLTGMAVQADGKIVIAGNGGGLAVLVRYLANGTLDPTFGTGGLASIPAGQMPAMGGVALQSTGMIVIDGGNADIPHNNGIDGNGFVARVWF